MGNVDEENDDKEEVENDDEVADAVGIGEGRNRREVRNKSWRGVVWEVMKFWNIWRKIMSVVFRYILLCFPIS